MKTGPVLYTSTAQKTVSIPMLTLALYDKTLSYIANKGIQLQHYIYRDFNRCCALKLQGTRSQDW